MTTHANSLGVGLSFVLVLAYGVAMTNSRQTERKYIELQEGIRNYGAECAQMPDAFFPDDWNDQEQAKFMTEVAKQVCSDCPISKLCLDYAVSANMYGIWGGTTYEERSSLRQLAQ